jgi:hypothetical protein
MASSPLFGFVVRHDEMTDGAHWAIEFTVDTSLLGRRLAKKHSRVGDQPRLGDDLTDLLEQFLLVIDRKARREIEICDGHLKFSFRFFSEQLSLHPQSLIQPK